MVSEVPEEKIPFLESLINQGLPMNQIKTILFSEPNPQAIIVEEPEPVVNLIEERHQARRLKRQLEAQALQEEKQKNIDKMFEDLSEDQLPFVEILRDQGLSPEQITSLLAAKQAKNNRKEV